MPDTDHTLPKHLDWQIGLSEPGMLKAKEVNTGAKTSVHAVWIFKASAILTLQRFWNNFRRSENNITADIHSECAVTSDPSKPEPAVLLAERADKSPNIVRTAFVTRHCEGCELSALCNNITAAASILNDRLPVTFDQMEYIYNNTGIDIANHPIPQGQNRNSQYDLDWRNMRAVRKGPFDIES